jgi:glycosyltransferase involved in cell wall biosynthesis
VVDAPQKFALMGCAFAHIAPYTIDASPRTPLEAAACGTPTICLDNDGTKEHIAEGVSGFACSSVDEMAEAIHEARKLDRQAIRDWVVLEHDIKRTMREHNDLIIKVAEGARW